MKKINQRQVEFDCEDIFPKRWSPRSLSPEVTKEDLMKCFEAARWAPSSYNGQPWRFVYAINRTPAWDILKQIPNEFNQKWALNAGALVLTVSRKTFAYKNKPNIHYAHDTGAAWMSFALQAEMQGLYTHAMAGIEYEKTKEILKIPEDYEVLAMFAVGKMGSKDSLPQDLKDKEAPSQRKPVSEFTFEGVFQADKPEEKKDE